MNLNCLNRCWIRLLLVPILLSLAAQCPAAPQSAPATKPNILFIAVDDLNDWIGCLGGNPQAVTPNFDRLAAQGMLFTNAHCVAPACNPSRSAIFTGIAPNVSGLYDNRQVMREIMPDAVLLPKHFQNQGYRAIGSGKLLHYFIDAASWDEYFPEKDSENPLPRTYYPEQRPVSLPVGGPWQYVETDWGPMPVDGEDFGGDWLVSDWVGKQLRRQHDQPFFLGCGIYRPHEPWFVPQKYFDQFPLESIQLPPGYLESDLDDVPAEGQRRGPNRYFAHIQQQNQWKQGIQGYLASIAFSDAMLGRVLDSLEAGPNRNNTIVVLWSDHGWHLGEKQHWQKYTGWRACTRVPLMVSVPSGLTAALPDGTTAGSVCDRPVSLLSLYPTLTELAQIDSQPAAKAPTLLPLLKNPTGENWDHVATTFLNVPQAYSISGTSHRYIHYPDGGEELYAINSDRYEWNNLASDPEHASLLEQFRKLRPTDFAEKKAPSVDSLTVLEFHSTGDADSIPNSRPDGDPFQVHFENRLELEVEVCWVSPQGEFKSYGLLRTGGRKRQQTRPGAVWMIRNPESQAVLGYFEIGDRTARAPISVGKQ